MGKKYKKEKVEYEKKVVTEVWCDWCGGEVEKERQFETREFELQYTRGTAYPSGGNKCWWQVEDLCDRCVMKLRALLADQGIAITGVEVDW